MSQDPTCKDKGIPEYLHRMSRSEDSNFSNSEILYR